MSYSPDRLRRGRRRVLVVDDNADAATSLSEVLRDFGHDVLMANEGSSAIKSAKTFRPDFIFLDLGLPGLDGFEVARTLKRDPALQRTQIVALTGSGQEAARERAAKAGFDKFMLKPMDPAFIVSLLGDIRSNEIPLGENRQAAREQVARVLKKARELAGGREALAARLGVEPYRVAEWIAFIGDPPYEVVNKAVELIVEGSGSNKSSPG